MEIYVDLRCLQDPCYAFRGVGYHASTVIHAGRSYFPTARWIGLVDPHQPALPEAYAPLVDQVSDRIDPEATANRKLFLQTSPMTHESQRYRKFLTDPGVLSAVLVYDFIPIDLADRYLTNAKAIDTYVVNLAWLSHYDLAFPISQYSARRLHDLVDIERDNVHVSGVALRPEFEQMLRCRTATAAASRARPEREFFLFVGGADRRKNLDIVLKAHARLDTVSKPLLTIVGNYPIHALDDACSQYRAYGGNVLDLQAKADITDAELARLYQDCLCAICSSEIEGFSLPPVEAICCGSAVLVSRNEAHQELVSLEDATFEVHDDERLMRLMQRATVDREWIQGIAKDESDVAKRFLAERVAYRIWGPISQRIRPEPLASGLGGTISRRRIALMTPFPPDLSGVADYTRKSVEEIGKLVDIDIFCETKSPLPTPEVCRFFPMSERPYQTGEYDQVVSVVGNSHFHIPMIEAQIKYGGPCLIHDNRLAELYNWWKGPEAFQQMAIRSLGRHVSLEESQDWIRDPGKLPSMFFDDLIPGARPLLLHSKGIVKHVKQQYGIDAEYLPFCVYREFPDHLLSKDAKLAARARMGIPADAIVVITLGMVGPTKAPHQCIEAISLARQAGIDAHLYFVGASSGMDKHIADHAAHMNVREQIHQCGDWVDEQQYVDFVSAADMAIQLRTHFFGGLSGAMLDCIASGLVTVANQDLAEAMDSPSTVLRVSDSISSFELGHQIIAAAKTFDLQHRLTAERERYLREHSFTTYAQHFVRALGFSEFEASDIGRAA